MAGMKLAVLVNHLMVLDAKYKNTWTKERDHTAGLWCSGTPVQANFIGCEFDMLQVCKRTANRAEFWNFGREPSMYFKETYDKYYKFEQCYLCESCWNCERKRPISCGNNDPSCFMN
ncbi:uncharacterized protein LOC125315868 [Rhodamnia argentea]|uniref:Uncharacterized protein LOC125315868 n=1 Tax=Rhodamnia argentea TaxID=178133 RepID=A0ABM3HMT8_9MYRT|nr:uncharacterized protein LOC125315868 [Rhodamnia argentea]